MRKHRSLQLLVLPFFFVCIISWAVLFFQFRKQKNFCLLLDLFISLLTRISQPCFKLLQKSAIFFLTKNFFDDDMEMVYVITTVGMLHFLVK
ncbi:hypothetical protein L1887_19078 [Cichorium endivia]|nr:hypothetical protein L1887_19078 [Cichorium endivia]